MNKIIQDTNDNFESKEGINNEKEILVNEPLNVRQKLFVLLGDYWWALLIIIAVLAFTTDVPIFQYALYGVGVLFALMIFAPFIFQLFAPVFFLISSLTEHFRESKNQSIGKRYIFIPATLLAAVGFITAQSILSIWVFVISFMIWVSVIGFFFSFLTIFFFGLAPLAIITAPFVVWFQSGFLEFLNIIIFFLIALFWFGFSKIAFAEDYYELTPEYFLGYSPHTFLIGALSFQVVALPFYQFGLNSIGNAVSDFGGFIFLILALISAFKWRSIKKKLATEDVENLYRPSVWIYIFGFFLTNLLFAEFEQKFGVPTTVLFWLNGFFLVALIGRFFSLFKKKKTHEIKTNE